MKNKLIIALTIPLCFITALVAACPACEKQQPKLLQGITHGSGPDGNIDYAIIAIAVLIVLLTLFYSVKFIFKPGEKATNHIKQIIFNID